MFNVYKKGLSNAFLPNNFTSVLKLCLKHRVRFVNHRARHAQAAVHRPAASSPPAPERALEAVGAFSRRLRPVSLRSAFPWAVFAFCLRPIILLPELLQN